MATRLRLPCANNQTRFAAPAMAARSEASKPLSETAPVAASSPNFGQHAGGSGFYFATFVERPDARKVLSAVS